MKETLLTNSERDFVLAALSDNKRIDGRQTYDLRNVRISFGVDRGCCQVLLGKTRVLAQVSAEITCPKPARPVEGIFYLNLELSPMATPQFEAGRLSSFGVELNRLLERCVKESRCLDLDSLCIIAGEKVWTIRVDVHVLNHDGNLIDCATIAAVTALSHFRRPEVSVSGEGVILHSVEEKEPVPLGIYHMPLCITFAFFVEGTRMLLDPNELEERVMEGKVVFGMNVYREICTLHISGKMLLLKDQVLQCANIACKRVADITAVIKNALHEDDQRRLMGNANGFGSQISVDTVLTGKRESFNLVLGQIGTKDTRRKEMMQIDRTDVEIKNVGPGTVKMGENKNLKWDSSDDEVVVEEKRVTKQKKKRSTVKAGYGDVASESSEEEAMILQPEILN